MQKQIVEKMEAGESRRIISPGNRIRRRKKPRTRTSSKERTRGEVTEKARKGEVEKQQRNKALRHFRHQDSQLHLLLEARTLSASQGFNTKHLSSVFYDLVP